MLPKMVIFDCDGVLVDSEFISNQVIRDDLAKAGLDMTLTESMRMFVGGTMLGVQEKAQTLGADIPDNWTELIYPKIYQALERDITMVQGIDQVLNFLDSKKIPFAVGSNGEVAKMKLTLGKTGLLGRFGKHLYSGYEVENPKPAPDLFLKVAEVFDIEPTNCLVVEDSASGAKAAHLAGMSCYGYAAHGQDEKLKPFCKKLFDDMNILPKLMQDALP